MSDIGLLTQITQTSAQAGGQTTALSGAQSGVTASGTRSSAGNAFWQFLFSLTGESEGEGEDKNSIKNEMTQEQQNILSQIIENPEKIVEHAELKAAEGKPLSLPELSLLLQEQDKDMPVEFTKLNFEQITSRIDELNKLLHDMVSALPADAQSNPFAETLIDRVQSRLETLQTSLKAIGDAKEEQIAALISLGLTPLQITEATSRIREVEEKIGRRLTPEDIIAGVGGILIPPKNNDDLEPTDSLAAALNEIVVSGTNETSDTIDDGYADKSEAIAPLIIEDELEILDTQNFAFETQQTQTQNQSIIPALSATQNPVLFQALIDDAEPTDEIAAQLNALNIGAGDGEEKASYEGLNIIARMAANTLDPSGTVQKAVTSLKSSFADLIQSQSGGTLQAAQGFFTTLFDGTALSADQDIAAILPMTASAQAAHSVTSIPQAGQTHPATQLVAANVSKMVKDGAPNSMRIELDPPELGRVNITLEFGPEKTAKVHLIAEKPETFMMLQRDAALLERALQNTGLDTNSASLSFELAEDGSAFNSKGGEDGKNSDGRRAGNDNQDDQNLIEASVDWHIDPNTGQTHYNLLA